MRFTALKTIVIKFVSYSRLNAIVITLFCVGSALLSAPLSAAPGATAPVLTAVGERTQYTYLGPGPVDGYAQQLLELAFEYTRAEYGDFELILSPDMSEARARKILREGTYVRPIRSDVSHPAVIQDPRLSYVPFPIYLGILGYRVCFVAKNRQQEFAAINEHQDLIKLVHGQGEGWRDVEILEENGFRVLRGPAAINLYKMLNANRIDMFCRGTNEVLHEEALYRDLDNVVLDTSIALYYPMPLFYYVNSNDQQTHTRITQGVLAAYRDGAVTKLWNQHFGESVNYSTLGQRKIFSLKNSYAEGIPFNYEQYLYQPKDERGDNKSLND